MHGCGEGRRGSWSVPSDGRDQRRWWWWWWRNGTHGSAALTAERLSPRRFLAEAPAPSGSQCCSGAPCERLVPLLRGRGVLRARSCQVLLAPARVAPDSTSPGQPGPSSIYPPVLLLSFFRHYWFAVAAEIHPRTAPFSSSRTTTTTQYLYSSKLTACS